MARESGKCQQVQWIGSWRHINRLKDTRGLGLLWSITRCRQVSRLGCDTQELTELLTCRMIKRALRCVLFWLRHFEDGWHLSWERVRLLSKQIQFAGLAFTTKQVPRVEPTTSAGQTPHTSKESEMNWSFVAYSPLKKFLRISTRIKGKLWLTDF
jgi:hypothetical protein